MKIAKPAVLVILGIITSLLVDLGSDGYLGHCKTYI